MRQTVSLCPKCYAEVPAAIGITDAVWMYKECPTCGPTKALVEKSPEFYSAFSTYQAKHVFNTYILNITDRCNVNCRFCYYPINRGWDMPIPQIVATAKRFPDMGIWLSGGDPTCREDLPEIVAALRAEGLNFRTILTNGVRLADPAYLDAVLGHGFTDEHGFVQFEMSIHTQRMNHPEVYAKKLQALQNLRERGKRIFCTMFSIESVDEIPEVLDFMNEWRDVVVSFRIRSPFNSWQQEASKDIYLSEMFFTVLREAEERGVTCSLSDTFDYSNIYNSNLVFDGTLLTLCSAPTKENIDLNYLQRGPYMLANDGNLYLVPLALIINEKLDKGL